jgi:aspartyl-tRNA(Asn)/glutamyl-tRNA(Gln) amidotransferase subunit A
MSELPRTIVEAADLLRNGQLSAVELTEGCLARSHAAQESMEAFLYIADEAALAAARQADADFAAGIDKGPLQGIPLGIKDIIATVDGPTTANSKVLDPAWGAGRDATVMKKLRAAGAIMFGKTGLWEFATGWPDPDHGFPIARNPWDVTRTPGGSSSGTGTAIAAGLLPAGLGTDTGGSVRGPAAYCGISGIKQTFGLVSKEGCVPLGYSLDNIGPMAHTVEDCAIMLQIMAGYDPLDACTVDRPVADMTALLDGSVAGVRIGVPYDYFFSVPELNPEMKAAALAALKALEAAGATLVDVSIPHAPDARIAQRPIGGSEAFAYHEVDMRTKSHLYGKYTRRVLQSNALFSGADYVQANRVRSIIKAECNAVFRSGLGADGDGVDVMIVPTQLGPAPTFAEYDPDSMLTGPTFMSIWNLVGLPALAIPCGFTTSTLPLSIQIVGRAFDEPTVFKVGDAYQRITDWHQRTPEMTWEMQPA